ncbi:hypothetical protein EYB53_012095 [Candidatus Chloroploca sp. M-50]|uniref:Uncharacterized protein n=1 Tax=Candidatus Chloroploca mongolica TaxID=2528176 RepID=A0ABS4DAG2_9CHLR|nr:hypothetical protein [Candidatus Chloroploca mongolica]MBP1466446.1 hypothetical protein [Candidatus Chloroploca mongolica]
MATEPCPCGITLPVVNVEGRTDEILRFVAPGGQVVPVLPLALWSVIKETPGVLRFQAIQTAPDQLKIQLEAKHAAEGAPTWERGYANAYFASQGLGNVAIIRTPEVPMRDPKSGNIPQHLEREFPVHLTSLKLPPGRGSFCLSSATL